jgi:molybdate transport system substrate-binding protein
MTATRRRVLIGLLAVFSLGAAACSSSSKSSTSSTTAAPPATTAAAPATSAPPAVTGHLTVFAAASLTGAFGEIGKAFSQANPGATVTNSFDASSALAQQITQGAPADVFASADTTNMDKLKADGFTTSTSQVFARNKLEIVVAPGNPKGITTLADLAKSGVIYITEAPSVPAGKYALQALKMAGVTVTPKSLETDVKSVVSKIELGEADAGIVYSTDVTAAGTKVAGVPIPDADNVIAQYPIAAVKATTNSAAANAFIAYVLSPAGQAKLQSFGFLSAS